ncbi:uncharacterized protein PAC_14752 [Phialocephala subalpina]|uniref:Uncharacterized protein n=1 Tax=Phialocephala subalpina TaxID=576137 RepID=A0A1L7XIJ7_9HELO|nr:uncharacterized protein PAC_14752 [Phialocephala subalpina]
MHALTTRHTPKRQANRVPVPSVVIQGRIAMMCQPHPGNTKFGTNLPSRQPGGSKHAAHYQHPTYAIGNRRNLKRDNGSYLGYDDCQVDEPGYNHYSSLSSRRDERGDLGGFQYPAFTYGSAGGHGDFGNSEDRNVGGSENYDVGDSRLAASAYYPASDPNSPGYNVGAMEDYGSGENVGPEDYCNAQFEPQYYEPESEMRSEAEVMQEEDPTINFLPASLMIDILQESTGISGADLEICPSIGPVTEENSMKVTDFMSAVEQETGGTAFEDLFLVNRDQISELADYQRGLEEEVLRLREELSWLREQ